MSRYKAQTDYFTSKFYANILSSVTQTNEHTNVRHLHMYYFAVAVSSQEIRGEQIRSAMK